MIASRGMYICNIAYIPLNWKDICIAYMNELGEIGNTTVHLVIWTGGSYGSI